MTSPDRLTSFDLLARNWTASTMRRLLGEPDGTTPHPTQPKRPPIPTYDRTRVELVEAGGAFAEAIARRRAKSDAYVERRNAPREPDRTPQTARRLRLAAAAADGRAREALLLAADLTGDDGFDPTLRVVSLARVASLLGTDDPGDLLDWVLEYATGCDEAERSRPETLGAVAWAHPELAEECLARLRTCDRATPRSRP